MDEKQLAPERLLRFRLRGFDICRSVVYEIEAEVWPAPGVGCVEFRAGRI